MDGADAGRATGSAARVDLGAGFTAAPVAANAGCRSRSVVRGGATSALCSRQLRGADEPKPARTAEGRVFFAARYGIACTATSDESVIGINLAGSCDRYDILLYIFTVERSVGVRVRDQFVPLVGEKSGTN